MRPVDNPRQSTGERPPQMTAEELLELREVVVELFGGVRIRRRIVHPQISSAALWELELNRSDGSSLWVMLKDLGTKALWRDARWVKPAFLRDPIREIDAYRHVLEHQPVHTARFHGAHIDPARDRYWLFLERLNAVPLWQVGSWSRWDDAALWLASLHDIAPPPAESPIVRYDVGFYEQWFERAASRFRGRLDELEPAYRAAMRLLAAGPPSLIHGEYYPSNILVRAHEQESICPIDFELFGVGSAALDLAALVTGLPERVARRVVSTYLRARSVPPDPARLDLLLLCARFHLAIRWLGWSSDWTPPRQHATDWAREARRAANALEAVA